MAQEQDARQDEERDWVAEAHAAAQRAGFKLEPVRMMGPDYRREAHSGGDDTLNIYPYAEQVEGEFCLTIHGDARDLPALLNPITPEQVRHSLLGAFAKRCTKAPHWKDMALDDFYAFIDDVLSRLTGGDSPYGQRTAQPGPTAE